MSRNHFSSPSNIYVHNFMVEIQQLQGKLRKNTTPILQFSVASYRDSTELADMMTLRHSLGHAMVHGIQHFF